MIIFSPSEERSISKLHDLFGKQAEKILNEGWLQCKVSLQEGKVGSRLTILIPISATLEAYNCAVTLSLSFSACYHQRATDRSWKQVWAVLRTNALHLRKERRDNTVSLVLAIVSLVTENRHTKNRPSNGRVCVVIVFP